MTSAVQSPFDVRDVRNRVQLAIDEVFDRYDSVLLEIGPEFAPVASTARSMLSGGKRLRAAACYWSWRAVAAEHADAQADGAALRAATSLEFLHGCALVHDDVMDASDTRRGMPSVHRTFEALHRDGGWRGTSEQFGEGAAVLVGDLLLSWADELLFISGLPTEAVLRAKPVYDIMRTELMAGQYLDLLEQASGDGSDDRVMRVARYKTAKYTIERPLHLGATLGGASDDVINAFTGYGLPLGEAFQLRDDVLGVFGDPRVTGKPAGDDLREGKRTLLIHESLPHLSADQTQLLMSSLGNRDLTDEQIERLRALIIDSGGLAAVETRISALRDEALAALDSVTIDAEAAEVLRSIAFAATAREA